MNISFIIINIILLFINKVKCFDEVYTNFTIQSASCIKNNIIIIDKCNSWCGSEYNGKIIYDSNTKGYEINIFYDSLCNFKMNDAVLPQIQCPKNKVSNDSGDEIICSNPTTIKNFKSFTIKETSKTCKNTININTCSSLCNSDNSVKIIKGSGTVNSYSVFIYQNTTDNCNKPSSSVNITCLSENQEILINNKFKLICNENDTNSYSSSDELLSSLSNISNSSTKDNLSSSSNNNINDNNNNKNNTTQLNNNQTNYQNNSSTTINYSMSLLLIIIIFNIFI